MTEIHEQELHEFMRLKHHSHGLKNQHFSEFPLFRDQGVGGSNPLSPTNLLKINKLRDMKTERTPGQSSRGSDQGSICPYLLKYLRAELRGDSSVREPGFTKKVYILAAIDPGTSC